MKNTQLFIIGFFTILLFGLSANAATWTVTKFTNSNDNVCDADCSLREAVFNADSGDTVVFDQDLFGLPFTLGGSEIVITRRITIDGQLNPSVAHISGDDTSRIFLIEAGGGLELKNAVLGAGNGKSSANAPGDSEGGAIYASNASLSLDRVAIRNNTAKFSGAIFLGGGTHHFINSSITSNTAETNTALGIRFGATIYMSNTTVSNNIYFVGDNNTFGAGAIAMQNGHLFIRNSTIANNTGRAGGGITSLGGFSSTIDIGNTIIARNTATDPNHGPDIYVFDTTITSRGGNLIGDLDTVPPGIFTAQNDITGVNPLLAKMNNIPGFPVVSHSLQAGSPARNGGLNAIAVDPLTNTPLVNDTRGTGFPRITDTTVDIGAFEDASGNTSLIVSKPDNSNDFVCDTDCSLREAVHQASLNFGTDTITFAIGIFSTLELGGSEILISNQNVNIIGYKINNTGILLPVSGGNANRIFRLNNATVNISLLALENGNAGAGFGGAILAENNSNLTLDKVIVRNNFATAYGAAHLSGGTHRIINSTINNNQANTGLALSVSGTLNMANTTVSSNLDADGGTGIGAIFVTGTANIRNSTIAFNRTSGGTGGGIFNAGTLNIGNTIVSNNIALIAPDINQSSGSITSVGGNLVQNTSGFPMGTFSQTNDVVNVDPLLAALADNMGNVTTHLLLANSPALNSGVNANALDPFDNSILTTDARGGVYQRIVGGTVDKGAFEALIPTAATVSIGGRILVGKQGVRNALVVLTDRHGMSKTAQTGTFGYYGFEDLSAGETYIIQVISKRYRFDPQVVTLFEDLSEINFIAEAND